MKGLFGQEPKIFENTEFLYNNSIAKTLEDMGYIGVYTEGAERILGWRSPNYVYKAEGSNIRVLLRNYRLSDDVAFRFSARDWMGWPLTAEKYAAWLSATPGQCVNIFIDYETFGEHQWPETGIMNFLKWLPIEVLKRENLRFRTPSELLSSHPSVGEISVQDFNTVSWADEDRSTGAWLGNDMQRTCYNAVRNMEAYVKKAGSRDVLKIWRLLQVSDHLYYMYTRPGASGLVHGYFSSQPPVRAFWSTMRIISDFYERVANILEEPERSSMRLLRVVPPDRAFHFHENGRYINLSAHSLAEFRDTLLLASDRSILFHVAGKHFEKWVRDCVGDVKLADELSKVKGETVAEIRQNLYNHVNRRLLELNFEET
jgi:alpha-amylase